jgi:hypothetical protein
MLFPQKLATLPMALQLCENRLILRKNAQVPQAKLSELLRFIENTETPNLFILLDTHADSFSGFLQHTASSSGSQSASVEEILQAFITDDILKAMLTVSNKCRASITSLVTQNGEKPWTDVTPKARGGWRVLVLATCGPAMRQQSHFRVVQKVVSQ